MAEISKLKVPSSNTPYDIKDATARNNILLLEQMNGAKNLAKVADGTRTGSGYFFANETSKIIDSNTSVYIVFDYELVSGQATVQLTDNNGNIISNTLVYTTAGTTSGHKAAKVTPTKAAYGYNAYYNSTGAVTISNMMIIPADIYEAGFTDYQPYALSNAELTAKEQANENNISTYAIPVYTEKAFAATTSGVYEYTGVSFTVPAGEVYEFIVADRYTGASGDFSSGLVVADSSTNINTNSTIIAENNTVNSQTGRSYWSRQVCGMTPRRNNATTYYVWANRGSNASSYICMALRCVFKSS